MIDLLKPNVGWINLLAALGLTGLGLIAIHTTADGSTFVAKQSVFLVLSLGAMLVTWLPHHRVISQAAYPLMIFTLVLLVILLLPGLPRSLFPIRNGARRWIDVGIVQFQPSEMAKIVFVLALARYLRFRHSYRTVRGLAIPLVMTFIPMGLILVEPDLGTALVFLPVLFAMLIAAGGRLKHLATIVVLGLVLMPAMYPLLQPHQKDRIQALISQIQGNPQHRDDIGYQGYKAMTLVGSGQVTGYGPYRSATIIEFNALPEAHNDMIFAVICARGGFVGGVAMMGIYVLFIGSGLAVAAMNKDPFARLVAVGLVTVVFTQMFVNVGMTLGILPITGMTLPFISYGGSSLLTSYAMVGLILNAASRRPLIMARPAFEFDGRPEPA